MNNHCQTHINNSVVTEQINAENNEQNEFCTSFTCKCGSTEFMATMITTASARVTSAPGYPKPIPGTDELKDISFIGPFICVKCGISHMDIECIENDSDNLIKRCTCGNTKFSAHQRCYHDIVVNSDNIFIRNVEIYEAENPYGTYCCTLCGAEYEYLHELNK